MAPRPKVVVNNDAPQGHNSQSPLMRDKDKFTYIDQQIRNLEEKQGEKKAEAQAATKAVNNAKLHLKSQFNLGLEEYHYARRLSELDPSEARQILANLIMASALLGITLSDDVFIAVAADPYHDLPDIERDRAIWKERGKIAAMTDKGAFAGEAPEGCPPDAYQAWAEGVNEGHEELARRMKAGEAAAGPLFAKNGAEEEDEGDEE